MSSGNAGVASRISTPPSCDSRLRCESPVEPADAPSHRYWLHADDCPTRHGEHPCSCGDFDLVSLYVPRGLHERGATSTEPAGGIRAAVPAMLVNAAIQAIRAYWRERRQADRGLSWRGGLPRRLELRAKDMLAASCEAMPALSEVAERCGLSRGHFSKAFKQSTGLSPRAWQLQQRLQQAEALLVSDAQPIASIAASCGFSDQSHLTRVFGQHFGSTPAQWRRLHRG